MEALRKLPIFLTMEVCTFEVNLDTRGKLQELRSRLCAPFRRSRGRYPASLGTPMHLRQQPQVHAATIVARSTRRKGAEEQFKKIKRKVCNGL
jgi:hypothetical protein